MRDMTLIGFSAKRIHAGRREMAKEKESPLSLSSYSIYILLSREHRRPSSSRCVQVQLFGLKHRRREKTQPSDIDAARSLVSVWCSRAYTIIIIFIIQLYDFGHVNAITRSKKS